MDLRRHFALIRAWLPLLLLSVVVASAAAYLVSGQMPKTYEAKVTMIVGQSLSNVNTDYNQLLVSQRLSTTYASVATKRPFLEGVIALLHLDMTPDDMAEQVRADAPLDSTLLTIKAQDTDPDRAAAIANALAQQLISASPAIQGQQAEFQGSVTAGLRATQEQIDATQAQVETLNNVDKRTAAQDAQLDVLEGRLTSLRSTYAALVSFSLGAASNLLSVVEPAVAPLDPVSPRVVLNVLVAAVLGLLLAGAVMFVATYLDDTVKDPTQVQDATGLGTLGMVARMNSEKGRSEMYQLATLLYPRSSAAEAYRTLRTNTEFASVGKQIRTLLVTSSNPSEGKTVTATNLAVVFAQAGRRVLLVDADLRKPGVHKVFNLPNTHGLTTMLRSDDVSLDAIAQATEQDNLRVLTTGPLPPNPAELLGSQRMQAVLDKLRAGGDLVIFDSAPLQAVTDSAIMASYLDGTILVIDASKSRRRVVTIGSQVLTKAHATVLGVVLNRMPARALAHSDYYSAYYGTAPEPELPPREPERSPS